MRAKTFNNNNWTYQWK